MEATEVRSFKKTIDGAKSSDSGDSMFKDVMVTFLKNAKAEFPNLSLVSELLACSFPLLVIHKPFNKNPIKAAPEQNSFFDDFSPRRKVKKYSNNSECEGSPLKLQSYADFSAFEPFECTTPKFDVIIDPEELRFGISLSLARKLTGIFNQISRKTPDANHPALLCFCDGLDRKRTACIYSQVILTTKKEYLGIKSSIVHVVDPVPNNGHLPNLTKVDFSRRQVVCRAIYDILNDTKEESLLESREYRLMLDVSWMRSQMNLNFLHMPPPEATTAIKAMVVPGSLKSSAAYPLFQELTILKNLIDGLQSSQITWLPEEDRKVNIKNSVKELFETLKMGDAYLKNSDNRTVDSDIGDVASKFVLDERSNYDFTDHLWKILSGCINYQDLVDALKYTFVALSNGELQPMVHRGNDTMIAQLVRDSFTGKLRIPNLAGLYPVELLVEIGIEKLKQDYLFIFLSKDLATRENLELFMQQAGGEFQDRFKNLEKMHSVVELIAMFQFYLKIPNSNLSAIAREVIHYYEKNQVSDQHVFKFTVPTSTVLKNLEGCPPTTWQIEATKLIDGQKEAMTHLLTSDLPFKHLQANDANMNTKEDMTINETGLNDNDFEEKMKKPYFLVKKLDAISILS